MEMNGGLTQSEPGRVTGESARPAEKPIACIDLDRFCEECSYNLRTLPVVRDSYTGIPVVRCTECGKFQPANDVATALRPWLRRLTSLFLALWMYVVVAALFGLGMGIGGINYSTLDELTIRGGGKIQTIGNTTYRFGGSGPLEVRSSDPEDKLFIPAIILASVFVSFVIGTFLVVVFPHWPRSISLVVALLFPTLAGAIVFLTWRIDAPHLLQWGTPYIAGHTIAQLFGAAMGVWLGRAAARLTIQVLLPPRVRPALAYLWHCDDKEFPKRKPHRFAPSQ